MRGLTRLIGVGFVVLALAGCGQSERPLKIVVPFAPGGESDTFARIMKKAIEENGLYDGPIVIVNLGGAGGTIGSRYVKDAKPDGYTVLLLHDALLTAKYFGKVPYGSEAFEPVAGTGKNGLLLVVRDNSTIRTFDEFLEQAKAKPESLVFGVNMGAPTHFVGLQLEHLAPGSKFRYTQSGGGSMRFHALQGGHIATTVFSVPEFLRFQPEGSERHMRALAYFGETRHPKLPGVPTAREQGIDISGENMQMWWVPSGTPRARIDELATLLDKARKTGYVRDSLERMHTTQTFLTGDALRERIVKQKKAIAKIPPPEPTRLPNFAAMVAIVIGVLGVAVVVTWVRQRELVDGESVAVSRRVGAAWACVGFVVGYVLVMQLGWMSFRMATLLFVLALGATLTSFSVRRLPIVAAVAVVMSFGVGWLFTSVFVVDLP